MVARGRNGGRAVQAMGAGDIAKRLVARAEGVRVHARALIPASASRLEEIERQLGPVPAELKHAAAAMTGMEIGGRTLTFTGPLPKVESASAGCPWRLFPNAVLIGKGPMGETYLGDISQPKKPELPIFGLWANPAVVMLVSTSLAGFLLGIAKSLPCKDDGTHRDFEPLNLSESRFSMLARLSRSDPFLQTLAGTGRRADPIMADWVGTLPRGTLVCDLRAPKSGMGFAWGNRRVATALHRHPTEPVMAATPGWRIPTAYELLTGRVSHAERDRCAALYARHVPAQAVYGATT